MKKSVVRLVLFIVSESLNQMKLFRNLFIGRECVPLKIKPTKGKFYIQKKIGFYITTEFYPIFKFNSDFISVEKCFYGDFKHEIACKRIDDE